MGHPAVGHGVRPETEPTYSFDSSAIVLLYQKLGTYAALILSYPRPNARPLSPVAPVADRRVARLALAPDNTGRMGKHSPTKKVRADQENTAQSHHYDENHDGPHRMRLPPRRAPLETQSSRGAVVSEMSGQKLRWSHLRPNTGKIRGPPSSFADSGLGGKGLRSDSRGSEQAMRRGQARNSVALIGKPGKSRPGSSCRVFLHRARIMPGNYGNFRIDSKES
jgi:hypothetical protein